MIYYKLPRWYIAVDLYLHMWYCHSRRDEKMLRPRFKILFYFILFTSFHFISFYFILFIYEYLPFFSSNELPSLLNTYNAALKNEHWLVTFTIEGLTASFHLTTEYSWLSPWPNTANRNSNSIISMTNS